MASVIKPDLYDPKLNRAYAEFAEHYGTFINPYRVGKADDKGKVERMIPQARELFRRLKEVHPTFNPRELNKTARNWCLFEYGKAKHGTTGMPPVELFEEEKRHLISRPETRFEIPEWKEVTAGGDRFFLFKGKYYAMPAGYRGKKLNAGKNGRILRVFDRDNRLLCEYIITKKLFIYLPGDFADDKEALMNGEYPRWLMGRAHSFGPATARLIESVLKPHAYINARRARGILSALEKYRSQPFLQELCGRALKLGYFRPKQIIQMFEAEAGQQYFSGSTMKHFRLRQSVTWLPVTLSRGSRTLFSAGPRVTGRHISLMQSDMKSAAGEMMHCFSKHISCLNIFLIHRIRKEPKDCGNSV